MVMRRNPELAADYARRHGVARWTSDAEALVHDPSVDAVYVATPPGTHLKYALLACSAGKPTYVEKPMARNSTEAERMVDAFRSAGVPLFIAYYRRALPRFVRARALIGEGRIGTPTSVQYSFALPPRPATGSEPEWRLQAEHSGGGLLLDLGSHLLDILDFLLGPLTGASGVALNRSRAAKVEDGVAMTFVAPGGVVGAAQWDFRAAHSCDRMEIRGTAGVLSLSCFGHEPIMLSAHTGSEHFEFPQPEHIQQPLIETIVAELTGQGRCPSTAETAARTTRVMDQVLCGYYGGRDDAFWERPETWPGLCTRP
jgi:predicted dehydrogenase